MSSNPPTQPYPTLGLDWSILGRFVLYVLSTESGQCLTSAGARTVRPGVFHFALNKNLDFDPTNRSGALQFVGSVHFTGHYGMLNLTLANPVLEYVGEQPRITIETGHSSVTIAELYIHESASDLAASTARVSPTRLANITSSLSEDATALFNEVYPSGTPLDPLSISY